MRGLAVARFGHVHRRPFQLLGPASQRASWWLARLISSWLFHRNSGPHTLLVEHGREAGQAPEGSVEERRVPKVPGVSMPSAERARLCAVHPPRVVHARKRPAQVRSVPWRFHRDAVETPAKARGTQLAGAAAAAASLLAVRETRPRPHSGQSCHQKRRALAMRSPPHVHHTATTRGHGSTRVGGAENVT